jgi:site-specific recombinase XerD
LPKPYTRAELEAIYAASPRPDVTAAMRFLHETGLRIAEACAIPSDEARAWPVPPWWCRRRACPRHRGSFRTIGKGDRERIVILTPAALRAARVLVQTSSNGHMMPWTDRGVRFLFDQVGQRAGVHCHPHRFRHTLASELVESGVPIEIVADMLGHSKVEITRLYWVASERSKVDALSRRRRFLRR